MVETVDTAPIPQATDKPVDPVLDKRVTDIAKSKLKENNFQQMMLQNPLMGLFMLLMNLVEMLGGEKSLLGEKFTTFVGKTFNVDNPHALVSGLGKPTSVGHIDVGERQAAVSSNIENAAKTAGIAPDLLSGIWGIESRFGTHKTLVSPSGCAGDFQFTKSTFDDVMKKHGAEIAALAGDHLDPATKQALQSGDWKTDTKWGSDLRFHPVVSTYASAFYLKDVAKTVGVDPKDEQKFGVIYAGYNVGPGNAQKLENLHNTGSEQNAGRNLGSAASWNPMFFKGGADATEALSRYQSHVMARIDDYHKNFDAKAPEAVARVGPVANGKETVVAAQAEQTSPRIATSGAKAYMDGGSSIGGGALTTKTTFSLAALGNNPTEIAKSPVLTPDLQVAEKKNPSFTVGAPA